ncbi:MAG TPA: ATP-dependent helicase HrpB [Steroidobacteraceae bacterium]|nr:ATP-dependent helicase HrpB [Steroidobacteraceae bacterium]
MAKPNLPALPITEALPALAAALAGHPHALLHAPPGAGKSTLVPLALLGSAWLGDRKILMLEPRRIAARAIARRMAELRGEPVGKTVGFRTRFESRVSRDTRIEVLTEGILTRMLQADPELPDAACVIFDEFHERSLNADLGLALCIESQQTLREDLRLLVMSATLDVEPLAALLGPATPIITSEGRSYEVTTHYLPPRAQTSIELATANAVRLAFERHEGDILCFLPGAAEIGRVQRSLEESAPGEGALVLPLYGELSAGAQDVALGPAPAGQRKIVLATSIAETSLTIEGVRVVVDSGLRRYAEFDPVTGMSRLVTGKVSQAAADQRRGRAGRLGPGVCYRLWPQSVELAAHTPPEIQRADLAPLALELACWGAAGRLRWLDPPPAAPLAQARDLLRRLEALDEAGRITPHGRALASMGAHPRLAHMLIKGHEWKASRLACDIAGILSARDVLRAEPGARDADLRLRVGVLRGTAGTLPPGLSVDQRALREAARSSELWQRELGSRGDAGDDPLDSVGPLVALAYPDRIGRARQAADAHGAGGRYLLTNGRGARFAEPQALARSEFIVAPELDGADRDARVFLAAPVALADLEREFGEHIVEHDEIGWDDREQAVRARRERRLGAIVLEASELRDPNPADIERAVLAGLRRLGVEALPWTRELRQWQARVLLMRRLEIHAPAPWPDVSDAELLSTLDEWAPPYLSGLTRREHFARMDLGGALRSRLSHAQLGILEREAPTHFVVPSGSRIPIDYLDAEPTLSVRLQEMFGLSVTPGIAGGRLPLVLKLLSPAGRPVQITRDLVSFWNRGYHEVRKDLKGRYPKHYWPEDPYAAQPTRRVRPR